MSLPYLNLRHSLLHRATSTSANECCRWGRAGCGGAQSQRARHGVSRNEHKPKQPILVFKLLKEYLLSKLLPFRAAAARVRPQLRGRWRARPVGHAPAAKSTAAASPPLNCVTSSYWCPLVGLAARSSAPAAGGVRRPGSEVRLAYTPFCVYCTP